jgi:hypothetical protein
MSSDPAERYLVVKGDQGLGNRILSLLSALLLARLTGRRLVVDWRDPFYASGGRDAFAELLVLRRASSRSGSLPEEVLETDSVRPAVWRGHLHEHASAMRARLGGATIGPRGWRPLCVDLERIDHAEHVLVFLCFHDRVDDLRRFVTGELAPLRRLSTDAILRLLWDENLALAAPLQARVDTFRRDHLDHTAIGVHVRASDKRTRTRAIESAVRRLVAAEPDRRIFVATDNADVLRRYLTCFRNVVATDKPYPPPGEPMHAHPARPDPIRDAADALVDLHLLAACGALVIDSRSSFGRLAALRSAAPRRRIVDVHPGRLLPRIVRKGLLRVRDEVVGRRLARGR